jgi:hypothetical protein
MNRAVAAARPVTGGSVSWIGVLQRTGRPRPAAANAVGSFRWGVVAGHGVVAENSDSARATGWDAGRARAANAVDRAVLDVRE